MTDYLELTAAELHYLIAGWTSERQTTVVDQLRLQARPEALAELDMSGFASLSARGLISDVDGTPVPSDELKVVLLGLYAAEKWVRAAGAADGDSKAVILVLSPNLHLVAAPTGRQTYQFALLAPEVTVGEQVARAAGTMLADRRDVLVLVSMSGDATEVRVGIAVDADGRWLISDSLRNPDDAISSQRNQALARTAEVIDAQLSARAPGPAVGV